MSLGVAIGAITFAGSIIAFAKLNGNMSGAPIILPARHVLNLLIFARASSALIVYFAMDQPALGVLGHRRPELRLRHHAHHSHRRRRHAGGGLDAEFLFGLGGGGIGFTLENTALIITGALVGSSGAILSYIMCKGMNRSFVSVIAGGFGGETGGPKGPAETRPVKQGSAEDAAFIMKNAASVIIVPGYGMAVAQAQHAVREMADKLKKPKA